MAENPPLPLLIELSQDKVDEAGQLLGKLTAQRRQAQDQLDMLDTYRADYTLRLQQATGEGISASNYHNFRRFIAVLDEAIFQQNRIIAQIDTKIEVGRQRWHTEKHRLNAFEILKTRQDQQWRYHQQRREQRVSDEISANLYHRFRQPR